jgi:hypothetical protein
MKGWARFQILSISAFLSATMGLSTPAMGLDLSISDVKVIQTIQTGNTVLVADRPTMVRVTVEVSGAVDPVPGVDASIEVFLNGAGGQGLEFLSINGPITAPLVPDEGFIHHTLNFIVIPPEVDDFVVVAEVNPPGPGRIEETDYGNNGFITSGVPVECRGIPEIPYIPIDYRGDGATSPNLPNPERIKPSIGDAFVYGILPTCDWDYHISPTPTLIWTSDIDDTSGSLLNELEDIREFTLPTMGFGEPEFVYGWLPGNPFGGNGQASGIPGDVAFGNTQLVRFQRTFAHEMGHLLGRGHNSLSINTVGVDVEHQLRFTQGLSQIMPDSKRDIMVAGQQTEVAWVAQQSYSVFLDDDRLQCSLPATATGGMDVLRVMGLYDPMTGAFEEMTILPLSGKELSPSKEDGTLTLQAYTNASVSPQFSETFEMSIGLPASMDCASDSEHDVDHPVLVKAYIPAKLAGGNALVDNITLSEKATGRVVFAANRSAHAPEAQLEPLPQGATHNQQLTIEWQGSDADGDDLSYYLQYSHNNGKSWVPLVTGTSETSFTFDVDEVPASTHGEGVVRLLATDGFHSSETTMVLGAMGEDGAPDVYLVTPNPDDEFSRGGLVPLRASAWDREDGMISGDDVVWESDVDGVIATGRVTGVSDLSVGVHTITVTGFDSAGLNTSESIDIEIIDRPLPVDPGDADSDGDLDLVDFAAFQLCFDPQAFELTEECFVFDMDFDGDVDLVDFSNFQLAFTGGLVCPELINSPDDAFNVCVHDQVVFTVEASGTSLSYQWWKDGQPISGATDADLVIDTVSFADAGSYRAIVTNGCGGVLSSSALLTVVPPPVVDEQPLSDSVCLGDTVTLEASGSGFGDVSYQWVFRGFPLPGATGPTLTVEGVTEDDIGGYHCLVSDDCGTIGSSVATINTLEVDISGQPMPLSVCAGAPAAFIVTAASASPVTTQWQKDGEDIPGAMGGILYLPSVDSSDAGQYRAVVTNECGAVVSQEAELSVSVCEP